MERRAFQDRIADNHCYGCGPGNEHGLHLKSFWDGDDAVCTFIPQEHHSAGPPHVLNGGIIATIVDCHSICTAIADHYRREQREIGTAPDVWCVTASLKIDYMHPVALDAPVKLRAHVIEAGGKKTKLACSVLSGGRECARGEVLAIRVPSVWREK